MNERATSVVDLHAPGANMYGCQPCPKCKKSYRYVPNEKPWVIVCDDCNYRETVTEVKDR